MLCHLRRTVSSQSCASLLRVLIRGPISVQGQFDLHAGSGRSWREPVSSSRPAHAAVAGGHGRAGEREARRLLHRCPGSRAMRRAHLGGCCCAHLGRTARLVGRSESGRAARGGPLPPRVQGLLMESAAQKHSNKRKKKKLNPARFGKLREVIEKWKRSGEMKDLGLFY